MPEIHQWTPAAVLRVSRHLVGRGVEPERALKRLYLAQRTGLEDALSPPGEWD